MIARDSHVQTATFTDPEHHWNAVAQWLRKNIEATFTFAPRRARSPIGSWAVIVAVMGLCGALMLALSGKVLLCDQTLVVCALAAWVLGGETELCLRVAG